MPKPTQEKEDMMSGIIITGTPLQQTPTGEAMQEVKPIIMTIPGDGVILGDGMEATAHIGVGTEDGVLDFLGAGEALGVGAAGIWDGVTHHIGATMILSGADITEAMDTLTGDMADIGVVTTTDQTTEEVEQTEEDLTLTTEALPINMEEIQDSEEAILTAVVSEAETPIQEVSEDLTIMG